MRTAIGLALILLGMTAAHAADSGIYVGAGVGKGWIRDDVTDPGSGTLVHFDSKDWAYKAFLGYRFTWLPIIDLAAEAAYTDFGNPAQTALGQRIGYKLHGASASGLLILPVGPLDIFGKAGAMSWSSEKNVGGTLTSNSGTNAVYGAGVGFRIWRLGMRAEYEYFDLKAIRHTEMLSVSAVFQF